jgi:hypothetical protein
LGGGSVQSQGLYLHRTTQPRETQTHIHAPSRIRTCDPNVRAAEDSTCLRLRGHWDRLMGVLRTVNVWNNMKCANEITLHPHRLKRAMTLASPLLVTFRNRTLYQPQLLYLKAFLYDDIGNSDTTGYSSVTAISLKRTQPLYMIKRHKMDNEINLKAH